MILVDPNNSLLYFNLMERQVSEDAIYLYTRKKFRKRGKRLQVTLCRNFSLSLAESKENK
jgi:hypothetical protein